MALSSLFVSFLSFQTLLLTHPVLTTLVGCHVTEYTPGGLRYVACVLKVTNGLRHGQPHENHTQKTRHATHGLTHGASASLSLLRLLSTAVANGKRIA